VTDEQNQGQPGAQTPAATEPERTTAEQQVTESRKAAQGEVPPFFGSGTVEAPVAQAAPDVAPTAPTSQPADGGSDGSSSEGGSSS
jgi:hypothetical protein